MTIDDLIKLMRSNRAGAARRRVTELIHEIERYSLGTEVVTDMNENDLKGGNWKFELKGEKLVLKK